jgi:UDP-N-acetylmuramoyl-tripeptide--D-alanyl-D-alanine ligase
MGTDFCVTSPTGEKESFSMYLVGAHNIINVLGAIAVANTLGVPLRSLKAPVRRLRSVAHRMELKEQGEVTVIDDAYNSNPVGSKAAVETLAMFDGVRIIITPGMVELGEKEDEYNRLLGTYAADCCDHILLVGRKRGQVIMDGALSAGFDSGRCRLFDRFEDAYAYALAIKEDGHKYILIENDLPDNY